MRTPAQVPDVSMRELLIEVEIVLSAVIEWNGLDGWQVGRGLLCSPCGAVLSSLASKRHSLISLTFLTSLALQIPESRPLEFNILQLDHKMRGNTLPLPRTMLKSLLNMFLPGKVV